VCCFLLFRCSCTQFGKRELTLFFLLASVFPAGFFHCRGFNEVDEDYWVVADEEVGVGNASRCVLFTGVVSAEIVYRGGFAFDA
jgi:hypothetical protein